MTNSYYAKNTKDDLLGPVVRKVDKVIHRIATFSNVLKLLIDWKGQMWCLAF